MIFVILVTLLICSAYYNQTTYINYLLGLFLILCILSVIYTIIAYYTTNIDVELDKEICYKNDEKKLIFTSASFLHLPITVKVVLYNKQLHKKQGTYYANVKTDGCICNLLAEECGDIDVIISNYYLKGFFGFFRLKRKFKRKLEFKIYPKPGEFSTKEIKELILSSDGEPINKKGGDYQELYEIRPIQPGDNLRYVHPSLSAKFDQYMIKVGSETQRKLLLYEVKNDDNFDEIIYELRKISAIYNEVCKDNNNYFCVQFKYKWYVILNDRSLFGLFDLIYKEYII